MASGSMPLNGSSSISTGGSPSSAGLLIHRSWAPAPHQPGAVPAGHSSGIFTAFIGPEAFRAAVVAVAIMAVFSLALGWLIAGRFVRPLRAIITTARDISASNLHRRLGQCGRGDEFTELGETLDDLFARLEASFESQRHFIANASHELRTPISAGRALLQVAIADPEPTVETLLATWPRPSVGRSKPSCVTVQPKTRANPELPFTLILSRSIPPIRQVRAAAAVEGDWRWFR
jgi:signal transduction histidine kinase